MGTMPQVGVSGQPRMRQYHAVGSPRTKCRSRCCSGRSCRATRWARCRSRRCWRRSDGASRRGVEGAEVDDEGLRLAAPSEPGMAAHLGHSPSSPAWRRRVATFKQAGGACVATAHGCRNSEDCRTFGKCSAKYGECFAVGNDCRRVHRRLPGVGLGAYRRGGGGPQMPPSLRGVEELFLDDDASQRLVSRPGSAPLYSTVTSRS
jgi:hypothetical protein